MAHLEGRGALGGVRIHVSYNLNSLKAVIEGLAKGTTIGVIKGDITLPETNMETQKGPHKDYSPSKRVLYGFPC